MKYSAIMVNKLLTTLFTICLTISLTHYWGKEDDDDHKNEAVLPPAAPRLAHILRETTLRSASPHVMWLLCNVRSHLHYSPK